MNRNGRTVLVTGASGFVGRQALAALTARGFTVDAVSLDPVATAIDGVTWHRADLLNPDDRRRLIDDISASHLLHLAWYVEHGRFWTSPDNKRWVAASLDLVRAFANAGGTRAVISGSCAEYDWNRADTQPWREHDPCRPMMAYGRAKLALFRAVFALAQETGLSLAWARFFFMFGFGEDKRRLVPAIIEGLLQNKKVALSSGRQVRDYMDTRDIADALASLLDAGHVTGAVNVASGQGMSISEMASLLAELACRDESLFEFGALPESDGEPPFMVADVTRLKHDAGFTPAHTLRERLAQCLDWHRKNLE